MENEVQLFSHEEFGSIRTVNINGEGWFCGKDVASALGYKDQTNAIKQHCRGVVNRHPIQDGLGRTQEAVFITEPDVFRLIVSSKLPTAQKFEAWVFEEVLPSVRRHGAYMTPEKIEEALLNPDTLIRLATDLKAEREQRKALEAENARMLPKAKMADTVLSADGTYSITQASRFARQVDPNVDQKRLFAFLKADEMITKQGNHATAKAIERGYLYEHKPDNRENPMTGEKKSLPSYARVTDKGLRWMIERYCKPQMRLEV